MIEEDTVNCLFVHIKTINFSSQFRFMRFFLNNNIIKIIKKNKILSYHFLIIKKI